MSVYTIPCGFRCHTTKWLEKRGIIDQPSLPFDNGFFPVESVVKFITDDNINLNQENTCPMIKHGDGTSHIKFISSTYPQINHAIHKQKRYNNQLLDTTRGYYTWCRDYDFVLAHYNWHPSSKHGDNVKDIKHNMLSISAMMNRRKQRLMQQIDDADEVHLVYWDHDHKMMSIDDTHYDLSAKHAENILIDTFKNIHKNVSFRVIGRDLL